LASCSLTYEGLTTPSGSFLSGSLIRALDTAVEGAPADTTWICFETLFYIAKNMVSITYLHLYIYFSISSSLHLSHLSSISHLSSLSHLSLISLSISISPYISTPSHSLHLSVCALFLQSSYYLILCLFVCSAQHTSGQKTWRCKCL
jgi:hypothetical protein